MTGFAGDGIVLDAKGRRIFQPRTVLRAEPSKDLRAGSQPAPVSEAVEKVPDGSVGQKPEDVPRQHFLRDGPEQRKAVVTGGGATNAAAARLVSIDSDRD
eukprot:CAMPEP_0197191724 /NCGR_PEP_ID=MMETSP1423-20130617/23925_1 /TAXON_ID=476441 /ORGANISM="Pseudo-nitzschia heimii, Strain UNC1101" /LENGTH=99 /DNA_ID=CAMNT_0042644453 /DNA_START=125 /DNA_END=422 /DNA_ORIENTATION=+